MSMVNLSKEIERKVEDFYSEHPFPDFELEKYNSIYDLEARASWYFKLLDTYIPENARIIEVGCGTGQFVNFLARKPNRKVVGLDLSAASLNKAAQLKDKLGIKNLDLEKRSIFDITRENTGTYQYVFCNGVIHHTSNPYPAFQAVSDIVDDNGFLIVGYYNTLGRIPLNIVKLRIKNGRKYSINEKKYYLDKLYTIEGYDNQQIDSWFADQFLHPQEMTVSIGKALKWFKSNNIQYINSFPPIEIGRKLNRTKQPHLTKNPFEMLNERLWKYNPLSILYKQLVWVGQIRNEGGYYTMIGKNVREKK